LWKTRGFGIFIFMNNTMTEGAKMNFQSGKYFSKLGGTVYVVVARGNLQGVFKTIMAAKKLKARIPADQSPEVRIGHFENDGSITTI